MLKWQEIQDTLQSVIQTISGLPVHGVVWEQLPQGFVPDQLVKLSLGTIRKIGQDETRYEMDTTVPSAPVYREVRYGNRVLNVVVKCESRNQNLAYSSQSIAEKIRTRIVNGTSTAALGTYVGSGPDIAVSSIGDIRTIDRFDKNEGRVVSYSILEINFNASVDDVDTPVLGSSWIETAIINQNYNNGPAYDQEYQVGPSADEEIDFLVSQDGFFIVAQDGTFVVPQQYAV